MTNREIEKICDYYAIDNYTINKDGTVDVDSYVDFIDCKLTKFPVRFGRVKEFFDCSDNLLTSLEGAPHTVGDFYCNHNKLTNLEGCPKNVSDDFFCSSNNITDINILPDYIGNTFKCDYNPISSIFNDVGYDFLSAFKTYKVIKDDTVNLKRLKYVMGLFDQQIYIKDIEKHYTIE